MKHPEIPTPAHPSPTRRTVTGRVAILLAVSLAVLVACGSSGADQATEYVDKARELQAQGNDRGAMIELKNALQADPEHAEARALLGLLELRAGDLAAAEKELDRARRLGVERQDVSEGLIRALLLQGRYADALALASEERDWSADPDWAVLAADAHLGLQDLEAARSAYEQILVSHPDHSAALRGLARLNLADGDTDGARRHIDQALTTGSQELETWVLKGELESSLNRFDEAAESFRQALEVAPGNLVAMLGLARALVGLQRSEEAGALLSQLEAAGVGDPRVHFLRALVARQGNDLETAQVALREVLRQAPNHAPSLLLAGQIHFLRREFAQAEEMLTRYQGRISGNPAARKLLAAVQLELRRPDDAIATLRPLEERFPDDAQLLAMLGTAHMAREDFERGRAYLDRAAELSPDAAPIRTQLALSQLATGQAESAVAELEAAVERDPNFSRADLLLILTHLQNRDADKALVAAENLVGKWPESPAAHNILGAAREAGGDFESARGSYQKALELQDGYAAAALNLGRLALRAGETDDARVRFESVLGQHPDHPTALVALARLESEAGRNEESLALLERARGANPQAMEPRLILANYHLRQGDREQAVRNATEAYAIAPRHPMVRLTLARTQLATGRAAEAVPLLEALVADAPEAAELHYQLAMAMTQANRPADARQSLERVLAIQPGNQVAQLALGNLVLRLGEVEEAADIAQTLGRDHPESPAGPSLLGDVALTQGRTDAAIEAYGEALERAPNSTNLLKLHQARRAHGDGPGANDLLRSWLEQRPDDAPVRLALAASLHTDGDEDAALPHYERVVELQPDNPIALNNLAWLYHERGDERAIEHARRAYERAPQRAEIVDTYGWLLLQRGQVEQGLTLLDRAVNLAPGNPDIRYHHAAGLARAGEEVRARRELESLLEEAGEFQERGAAESLLRTLR